MSSHALVLPVGVFTSKSDWTAAQLTATWVRLESQINPFNRVLNIPGDLFRTFDVGAKRFIANAFMLVISPKRMFWNADSRRQQTQEMVMFCRDGTGYDRYFLGNPRHFLGGNGIIMEVSDSEPFWFPCLDALEITRAAMTKPIVPPTKNKEKKIPRPPNAYILYRKERHTIVKEANPGITNNEICEFMLYQWHISTNIKKPRSWVPPGTLNLARSGRSTKIWPMKLSGLSLKLIRTTNTSLESLLKRSDEPAETLSRLHPKKMEMHSWNRPQAISMSWMVPLTSFKPVLKLT